MLREDQVDHFDDFGFLVLRGVFPPSEMDELRATAPSIIRVLRGTGDYIATHNLSAQPWCECHPVMANIVGADRICEIGQAPCGPDFWLYGTEGHVMVGNTA